MFDARAFMKDFTSKIPSPYTGYRNIDEPQPGQVVYMPEKNKELRPIKIVSGQYWGMHGLSNFWYWREITNGEESSEVKHGYGDFYIVKA